MMKMKNDPFRRVIKVVKARYPKLKAEIIFTDRVPSKGIRGGAVGCTIFPDDGSTPLVFISAAIPVWGAVEVLAHELAHVIVGTKGGHGSEWKKTFGWIHREWVKSWD